MKTFWLALWGTLEVSVIVWTASMIETWSFPAKWLPITKGLPVTFALLFAMRWIQARERLRDLKRYSKDIDGLDDDTGRRDP